MSYITSISLLVEFIPVTSQRSFNNDSTETLNSYAALTILAVNIEGSV